jgi:GNAT superfamily N-acetyltransferase
MDYLREFYDIMGKCDMPRPPYAEWRAWATDNAEVWPINGGGKMIGAVLFKGHTIHIAVLPEWRGRWIKPSMLKAWRNEYPHAADLFALPHDDNREACELAERLGFREAPGRAWDAFGNQQSEAAGRKIYVKESACHPH